MKQAYTIHKDLDTLPKVPGVDTAAGVRDLCEYGLKRIGKSNDPVYRARLQEELEVILDKDFSVYFIILWDIMKFCRQQGIATGAARGSAGGSLVSYLLEITALDPIQYGLLFWRFLDPSREEAPDIDMDIADKDRPRVRKYIEDKYGKDNVAGISTINYFSFKSAFKGACRVLAVPFKEANDAVAEVETKQDALNNPKFIAVAKKYPDVLRITQALEGRISGVGMHAAAVVITSMPLTDITTIESRGSTGEEFRQRVVGLDKRTAEALGLIKIDLLGLKSLSVIADACALVKQNHGRIINWKELDTDDAQVYEMLTQGHTLGVFQAEKSASTKLIKDMGVYDFSDLVASNALVRSGAWNAFGPEFVARKKGHKTAKSVHPDSDWFLAETQQLALYQEQTMQICTELAGMSMKDANAVRRLTAHKEDKSTLAPYRDAFITGAAKKVGIAQATKLWENIEITSEYQFNKCLAHLTKVQVKIVEGVEEKFEDLTVGQLYERFKDSDAEFYVLGPEICAGVIVQGVAWQRIVNVHDQGVQTTVRIWTEQNKYIEATPNHRHKLSKNWKMAHSIHQGDQIWTTLGKAKVAGRRVAGEQQTYDIELAEDSHHGFFANGFVTHNSHSVGYSRLSFAMAYLKYHYAPEFMVALLNNESDQGSVSDYLAECKRLGIKVKTPDVNLSDMHYSTRDNKIYMGLSNIKYISDTLASRLIQYRPYESYADLVAKITREKSGLSTRVLGSLNAIGATEFPDHPVDPEEVKNNFYEYLGIPSFDSGMITQEMRSRLTPLDAMDSDGANMIVAIVKDIVSKNGWTRIEVIDGSSNTSFFAEKDHGVEKGHKYIFLVAGNSLVDALDLADFITYHPLVRWLRGKMEQDTYLVGAKARVTKNQKNIATMVYSHFGKLSKCMVFSTKLEMAKTVNRGDKIRIQTKYMKDNTEVLERVILDDRTS